MPVYVVHRKRAVAGLLVLALGLGAYAARRAQLSSYVHTEGRVCRYASHVDGDGDELLLPHACFTRLDGRSGEVEYGLSTNVAALLPAMGAAVPLAYDPDGDDVLVLSFAYVWGIRMFVLAYAVFLLVSALVPLERGPREREPIFPAPLVPLIVFAVSAPVAMLLDVERAPWLMRHPLGSTLVVAAGVSVALQLARIASTLDRRAKLRVLARTLLGAAIALGLGLACAALTSSATAEALGLGLLAGVLLTSGLSFRAWAAHEGGDRSAEPRVRMRQEIEAAWARRAPEHTLFLARCHEHGVAIGTWRGRDGDVEAELDRGEPLPRVGSWHLVLGGTPVERARPSADAYRTGERVTGIEGAREVLEVGELPLPPRSWRERPLAVEAALALAALVPAAICAALAAWLGGA